jgi:hypothetical protein
MEGVILTMATLLKSRFTRSTKIRAKHTEMHSIHIIGPLSFPNRTNPILLCKVGSGFDSTADTRYRVVIAFFTDILCFDNPTVSVENFSPEGRYPFFQNGFFTTVTKYYVFS